MILHASNCANLYIYIHFLIYSFLYHFLHMAPSAYDGCPLTCHTCIENTVISLFASHISPGCKVQNNNNDNIIVIVAHPHPPLSNSLLTAIHNGLRQGFVLSNALPC